MIDIPQVVSVLVDHFHEHAAAEALNCSPHECAEPIIEQSSITLEQLQEIVCGYTFANDESEILFFKEMKTSIVSDYLFYGLVRSFHLNMPMGGDDSKRIYIADQLSYIGQFFETNKPMIMDIREGRTHQDAILFLRKNYSWRMSFNSHDAFNHRGFTTNGDHKLALYKASTRFQDYLCNLSVPDMTAGFHVFHGVVSNKPWPLNKVEVVEMAISLHAAGKAPVGYTEQQTVDELARFFRVPILDMHPIKRDIAERVEGPDTLIRYLGGILIESIRKWNLRRDKKYEEKRLKG